MDKGRRNRNFGGEAPMPDLFVYRCIMDLERGLDMVDLMLEILLKGVGNRAKKN